MFVLCVTLLFRVGIQLPTIEVRYENLMVDAKCFVGSRALPTLKNVTINILEVPIYLNHLPSNLNFCLTCLEKYHTCTGSRPIIHPKNQVMCTFVILAVKKLLTKF